MPDIPVDPSQPFAEQQAKALADHKKALEREYGQYVAVGPIYLNGVLAYTKGQAVPASNVEQHGYVDQGHVRRVDEPEPEPNVVTIVPDEGEPVRIGEPAKKSSTTKTTPDSASDNK